MFHVSWFDYDTSIAFRNPRQGPLGTSPYRLSITEYALVRLCDMLSPQLQDAARYSTAGLNSCILSFTVLLCHNPFLAKPLISPPLVVHSLGLDFKTMPSFPVKALAASCLAACSLSVSGFVVAPGAASAVAAAQAGAGLATAGRKDEVTRAAGVGRRHHVLMRYVCIYI